MSVETRLWHPPSLCGCGLLVTGDWLGPLPEGGVQYQHPKPWTITSLAIVEVCGQHLAVLEATPDTSAFFDVPEPGSIAHFLASKTPGGAPVPVQHRGYRPYPYVRPTDPPETIAAALAGHPLLTDPGERLYAFLTRHRGQTLSLGCGCVGYQHFDELGHAGNPDAVPTHLVHPLHSKKCPHHQADTPDLAQARADMAAYHASRTEPSS